MSLIQWGKKSATTTTMKRNVAKVNKGQKVPDKVSRLGRMESFFNCKENLKGRLK